MKFSKPTYLETLDYIYVYDKIGNQIGCYTGDQVAGRIAVIPGDTAQIRLKTNNSNTYFGYSFDQIYGLVMEHQWTPTVESAPTCTEPGYPNGHICELCGALKEGNNELIPELGHEYTIDAATSAKGITYFCTRCGDEIFRQYIQEGMAEGGLNWKLDEAGTLIISGEGPMITTDGQYPWTEYKDFITTVIIEDGITDIGSSAFLDFSVLDQVYLGEDVRSIGSSAFAWSGISKIELPDALISISSDAFFACSRLQQIALPDGLQQIGESAFSHCGLEHIVIPDSVISIDKGIFWGNENLQSVVLPDGITCIPESMFHDCESLRDISIPDSVTQIGPYSFFNCAIEKLPLPSSITVIEYGAFGDCTELTEIVLPESLTMISSGLFAGCTNLSACTIPEGISEIGGSAFSKTNISKIIIPKSVSFIDDSAFEGCRLLSKVEISPDCSNLQFGEHGRVFYDCVNLTEIVIPEGTTFLGFSMFENCTSLKSVTLPSTLNYIDGKAFENCTALESVYIPSIETWCNIEFPMVIDTCTANPLSYSGNLYVDGVLLTDLAIPQEITEIKGCTFYGCNSIKRVLIPASVTQIAHHAFAYCKNLLEVELQGDTQKIEHRAFQNCESLKSILLPDSITSIGEYAFSECKSLESIRIPKGVTTIEHRVFCNCESLEKVFFQDGLTDISSCAFQGCKMLNDVYFPETLVSFGNSAFAYCESLSSITIPQQIKSIPNSAFAKCYSLTDVILTEGLTQINDSAFSHCTSLTSISIPASVNDVGDDVFFWSGLSRLIFAGSRPNKLGSSAFSGMKAFVYVPANDSSWDILVDKGIELDLAGEPSWVRYANVSLLGETHHTVEEGKHISIHASAEMDTFSHVTIDGVVVTPENYFITEGSTIVTFIPGYLETLSKGEHAVAIHFENESVAFAIITVNNLISHEWGDWKIFRDSSCAVPGEERRVCSRCGYFESREIEMLAHSFDNWTVTQKSTCTENGIECRKCINCDHYETREIAANGHVEVIDKAVEATCTTVGKTEGKHCSVCSAILVVQHEIPAKGHNFSNWKVIIQPTCTSKGQESRSCGNCDYHETQEIAETGHIEVIDKAVIATCTTDGTTEGKHCSTCNEILVKQEVVKAIGHEFGDWETVTEPTEKAEGKAVRQCKNCDVAEEKALPKLDHVHKYTEKVTQPTCTEKGYTTYTCSCGDTYKDSYVDAMGHTEVIDKAIAATCTEDGLTEGKHCSVCDEVLVKQEVVKATGHEFGEWKTVVEPTEESEGKAERKCKHCEETEEKVLPKLDHVHSYAEQITKPTCTENGYTTYTCTCGSTYKDNYVDATGHTEAIDAAVAATCTENGLTEGKHCSACKVTLVKQDIIKATGHEFGDWETVTEPTEEAEGKAVRQCEKCDVTEEKILPKLDHVHDYTETTVEPTCTEKGYTAYVCTCGESYNDNYVEALGHTEVIDEAVSATCTENGLTEGKHCSVCNEILIKQEIIQAAGHEFGDWETITKPTEFAEGKVERKCKHCDKVEEKVIQKLDHIHSYAEQVIKPTCTEDGYTKYVCDCGDSYKDNYVAAVGHAVGEWISDSASHWRVCSVCSEKLDATEHDGATCSICGYESSGEDAHEYQLGDVNHDGKINAKDATLILQKSVGVLKETAKFCEDCAEVSGDGKLNAKDSTLILQFSVGLRDSFPAMK